MTNEEWTTGTDLKAMIDHLLDQKTFSKTNAGRRKLRLFICGCARRLLPLIQDYRLFDAVELAERFADGNVKLEKLASMNEASQYLLSERVLPGDEGKLERQARTLAIDSTDPDIHHQFWHLRLSADEADNYRSQSESGLDVLLRLIRCTFRNPFEPMRFHDEWRTSDVRGLALAAYEDFAFDRLPILADALEEAGCDNVEMLNHCRESTMHIRGCWVLDSIFAKK